jgi:hypothetical protein
MTTITGPTADRVESPGLAAEGKRWNTILRRVLQLSFLFFLLKGLAWLAVGFMAWRGLT